MNNDRRTNSLMREFLTLVLSTIERGELSLERAAELMLEHQVPHKLAGNVLMRAQLMQNGSAT